MSDHRHFILPVLLFMTLCAQNVQAAPVTINETRPINTTEGEVITATGEYAPGFHLGAAFVCKKTGPEIILNFGDYPGEDTPVQTNIRLHETITTFSPRVAGNPNAGFHSPILQNPDNIQQFIKLALTPGALINNNYRGFYLNLPDSGQPIKELIKNCPR